MTDIANLSNVAYKKGNWMRYTLWGIGAIAIGALMYGFFHIINADVSSITVPDGYKFAVKDDYLDGSRIATTYYIYDGKIFVEDESEDDGKINRSIMIYDNISTSNLSLDENDTIEICELGACSNKPKVLAVIKKLVRNKIGREYIRL